VGCFLSARYPCTSELNASTLNASEQNASTSNTCEIILHGRCDDFFLLMGSAHETQKDRPAGGSSVSADNTLRAPRRGLRRFSRQQCVGTPGESRAPDCLRRDLGRRSVGSVDDGKSPLKSDWYWREDIVHLTSFRRFNAPVPSQSVQAHQCGQPGLCQASKLDPSTPPWIRGSGHGCAGRHLHKGYPCTRTAVNL